MAGTPKKRAKRERTEAIKPKVSADKIINFAVGGSLSVKDFEECDQYIKESGLPKTTQNEILRRLREMYAPELTDAIKSLDRKAFIDALKSKQWMILSAITPQKIEDASLRDLATSYGVLQDKLALLLGQPTAIVTFERQEKMNEMMKLLLREANERGITLEQQGDGSYGVQTEG